MTTQEQREQEYVKALLEYIRDDSRQVYVKVTGALAVAALFATQLPFDRFRALDLWARGLLIGGLAQLIVAALAYFTYTGIVHHARLRIAGYLRTGEGPAARDAWLDLWNDRSSLRIRNKWWFWTGDVLFGLGGLSLAVVFATLLVTG
jgi:hypothetical protein